MPGLSHMSTPGVGGNLIGTTLTENEEEGFHNGNSGFCYEIEGRMDAEEPEKQQKSNTGI